jgi:nitrogen regulatory protein P-II 2
MQTVPLKIVTIVAEAVLAERLTMDLKQLGAKGFTLTDVRGEGSRHLRAGEFPGENVKIESVVSEPVAERVLDHIAREYFSNYAVIVYVANVAVVRGDKYV